MTHEAGHVLGLLHPCEVDGDQGPRCDQECEFAEAMMYPLYDSAQVNLSQDDVEGVCFLYPAYQQERCELVGCSGDAVCTPLGCVDAGAHSRLADGGMLADPGDCPGAGTCDAGACAADACSSCEAPDACTVERDCERDRDPSPRCNAVLEFGQTCHAARACKTGHCLEGVADEPVCTRQCGRDQGSCPQGWHCARVDDQDVCIPSESDGCTATGAHASWSWIWPAWVLGMAARRRRSDASGLLQS